MPNFKAPLIKSLDEAGFSIETGFGGPRTTFTAYRKRYGNRRVKLWFANDVFTASTRRQELLEDRLKANYGAEYLGGYFIEANPERSVMNGQHSFCILLAH